jgi:hypothetical protein
MSPMRKKPQHEQHQQLELDLWQIFAVAQAAPATADMVLLCSHLDGLDLVDGARAIGEIGEIFRSKAEIVLAEIAATYLPEVEPVIDDELLAHLYLRTYNLNDDHLYLESEHYYPEERQSVIKLGSEADRLVAELLRIEAIKGILGNAHSEDIQGWAAKIRKVMVKVGEISLLDLQTTGCGHLEGLDLFDGARAIEKIGEIFRLKAEVILAGIAAAYLPQEEPMLDDELWAHLYQRSFILNDEHLYLRSEHIYPEERQSVIQLGLEAKEAIESELCKSESEARQRILGNAHSEDVASWAQQILGAMAEVEEMTLLELEKKSRLSSVDLWLGLLLGDTGCFVRRGGDQPNSQENFYCKSGILVKK